MTETDFCWPILLADKIGQLYQSSDIFLSRWTSVFALRATLLNANVVDKPTKYSNNVVVSVIYLTRPMYYCIQ